MDELLADPSITKALDKVDEVVTRLQQLQNTIANTRRAVSVSPKCQAATLRSDKQVPVISAGEWKQWSAPAELLHQTLCDILAAAKNARRASGGGGYTSDDVDVSQAEHGAADEEKREIDNQAVAEPIEEGEEEASKGTAVNKSQLLDELERSKFVTRPAASMQVSKVKETQKAWKLPQKKTKGAVMFPNVAYSPASPPKQFRILTPFKSPSLKKNNLAEQSVKPQKVPLLGKKKCRDSPVHSLPTLIDRLPSKARARPGVQKKQSAGAGNVGAARSKELPYPPSHFSQVDRMKSESRRSKSAGRNATEPFKPRACNASPPRDDDGVPVLSGGRQHKSNKYVKLSSVENTSSPARARSISPRRKRSDKENLLVSDDAAGNMRRSWSAGSASAFGKKNNPAGHTMLQRAKGWVLGK